MPDVPMMTESEYVRFHRRRYSMMTDLLRRHLPAKVDRVLDIGGGGDVLSLGAFLRDTFGAETHGVSLGDDVSKARDKGILCEECDVDRQPLPYGDAHFDVVVFASVIEHLYHPQFALGEIARVLKTGGFLLIEAPNAVSMGHRIDALKGRNPFRFFNEYNAAEPRGQMITCSVFYTPEEILGLPGERFDIVEQTWGMHTPRLSVPKMVIHEVLTRLFPRMSDCFALIARRDVP